ncbi:MAG TPA: Arm DNA-binding domain-containing protein, partial [Vicinamibacteria bacterium]|nr:Arm DNA-binding domain-containing protein [Vicinamibacteria bacterium]
MPTAILTTKNVATLRPRAGKSRDLYRDGSRGAPRGFALRVRRSGPGAYYLVYQRAGRKHWWWLGDVNSLGLGAARDKARTGLDLLRQGLDPREEERRVVRERAAEEEGQRRKDIAESARPTLARLVERFIAAHKNKYREKTLAEYQRMLRTYVTRAEVGSLLASDIRRFQLRAFVEDLAARA